MKLDGRIFETNSENLCSDQAESKGGRGEQIEKAGDICCRGEISASLMQIDTFFQSGFRRHWIDHSEWAIDRCRGVGHGKLGGQALEEGGWMDKETDVWTSHCRGGARKLIERKWKKVDLSCKCNDNSRVRTSRTTSTTVSARTPGRLTVTGLESLHVSSPILIVIKRSWVVGKLIWATW